jgi:hypothetical protein
MSHTTRLSSWRRFDQHRSRGVLLFLVLRSLLVLCFSEATSTYAQFLETELQWIQPSGGQAGTAVDLTVVGERLEEADGLHCSHPGIHATVATNNTETVDSKPTSSHFRVEIDPDVPPGRYDLRVLGPHGVSNPRAFVVTDLPHLRPSVVGHQLSSPAELELDSVMHGCGKPATIDYYALKLETGQAITVELFSQRIDSRMIGQLRLLDSSGRVIMATRGADHVDPVLVVDGQPSGFYILAVNDFTYRGGDEYGYQLVAQHLDAGKQSLRLRSRVPESFSVPESVLLTEAQKADVPIQPIVLPHDSMWRFAESLRSIVFEFEATQGDSYSIDVISQRLGEPTDIRLSLKRIEPDPSGMPILHDILLVDDGQQVTDGLLTLSTTDPVAMFVAPETATYQLTVRDLDTGDALARSKRFYLRIAKPVPTFDLVAYQPFPHLDLAQSRAHGSRLFRGGTEGIRVVALRRDGWTGPIEVSATNLPAGITCSPATIGANQTQTLLTLTAGEDASRMVADIRIVGVGSDRGLSRAAVPVTILANKGGNRDFTPMRICDQLAIAIDDMSMSHLSIRLGDPLRADNFLAPVKCGETLRLPITISRQDGGQETVKIYARDLPPGVAAADVVIDAGQSTGNLELAVESNTAPGVYSIWVLGETKIKLTPDATPLSVFVTSTSASFQITGP